ncbi:hypothetical protein RRG08_056449 [Elysia crispata]|uniref:Uncharacterized protein n=1 Tax=Elysia crispata TaxID=231223 RepID=A0AAE0ZC05_9GAST|nr:hypothetical protein RRG08_056449 [Elysia crispata]
MDSGSVVSSISLAHSFDFAGRSAGSSSGRGRTAMVRQHQDHYTGQRPGRTHSGSAAASNSNDDFDDDDDTVPHPHHYHHINPHQHQPRTRRESVDIYQHSETISIGGVTDLSAERPATHDTSRSLHLMRDASALCGQPDKSNFREKLRHWTVLEDSSSPLLAPRPITSLANQKPSGQLLMTDVEREMSLLMSRPSTSNFPAKPKELIEPLDGLLPSESPVTQKKFLVLPSIGHGMGLRRQRSNLETINQLDYSRHEMEDDADFFAGYHNSAASSDNKTKSSLQHKPKPHRQNNSHTHNRHKPPSPSQLPQQQTGLHKSGARSSLTNHQRAGDLRESPSKAADTPMPLPPIPRHHPKHPARRAVFLPRADHSSMDQDDTSSSASCSSPDKRLEDTLYDTDLEEVDEEDEEDLDRYRQRTPETYRCGSPPDPITPPPGFR